MPTTLPPTSRLGRPPTTRPETPPPADFIRELDRFGFPSPQRRTIRTLQLNLGKLCNQACHHCHVEAGPKRTEIMSAATADRALELLEASTSVEIVDFTGGAPELCPSFRHLVEGVHRLGRRAMVRCNLTVLYEPGMQWLPQFYVDHEVELVCSLPCYTAENLERQRGIGVFAKSIKALQTLNGLGYGTGTRQLDLVFNPVGPTLPPPQDELQTRYKEELARNFDISFDRLLTITNMPIKRFSEMLARTGQLESYLSVLVNHFNPATVDALMCRDLVSVGWDGSLYDCDFNQMLEIPAILQPNAVPGSPEPQASTRRPATIFDLGSLEELLGAPISTAEHCFGCTAGAGSSCGGNLTNSA